jgi:hypothetical protein
MRVVLAASTVATVGLIAAGVLGVAGAETPPATTPATVAPAPAPARIVSVQGVAIEPIDQSASVDTATSVYRQGMADAVTDGQTKAQFLAGHAGATLGAVQSMTEGGGYITCSGESEYLGGQPDFGSPAVSGSPVPELARGPLSTHAPSVKKPSHKRATAKHASAASCTLSTHVSLVYALS